MSHCQVTSCTHSYFTFTLSCQKQGSPFGRAAVTRPALRHLSCASPTDYAFGWITFWVSIILIGIVTAFIGDIASHLGCTIGLADSVNAIAFVALGTSVPGNVASWRSCYTLGGLPLTWCNFDASVQTFLHAFIWCHLADLRSSSGRPAWGGGDSDSLAGLCNSSFGHNSESQSPTTILDPMRGPPLAPRRCGAAVA